MSAHAALVTKLVAYEHAGVKLAGYLAYDDAKVSAAHPAPGVLWSVTIRGHLRRTKSHPRIRAVRWSALGRAPIEPHEIAIQ